MRKVEVVEGLRLRFPGRAADFDDGVEVGIAAALMAIRGQTFSHRLSPGSLDQVRPLAVELGYRLVVDSSGEGWCDVSFRRGPERPRLVLAHSRPARGIAASPAGLPSGRQPGAETRAGLRCI